MAEQMLTDKAVQAFINQRRKGAEGKKKLSAGGGLYMVVSPRGKAVWRLKYRLGDKEMLHTLGAYPALGLAEARRQRDSLRQQLLNDPRNLATARRLKGRGAALDDNATFRSVAELWLEEKRQEWSAVHYRTTRQAMERDVYPTLGDLPVAAIQSPNLKVVVDAIQKRGAIETARKVLQNCGGVFRLAQVMGLHQGNNPAYPVKETLRKKKKTGHLPAVTDWETLGTILRAARAATATSRLSQVVHQAHRLCAFTATRLGNIVGAKGVQWNEFDLEATPPIWTIPRSKMKAQDRHHDHKVILSPTIADELKAWKKVWNVPAGSTEFLFKTGAKLGSKKAITHEAIEKAYREILGLKGRHTPHGWRSAFSTLARENGFAREVVEIALDHVHDNETALAYDRGDRMQERIRLMNWWGENLTRAEQEASSPHKKS